MIPTSKQRAPSIVEGTFEDALMPEGALVMDVGNGRASWFSPAVSDGTTTKKTVSL